MNRQPPMYGAIDPAPQVVFSDERIVEFNNVTESVATNIDTINSGIKTLENASNVIGTSKDNRGLRNQIHVTQLSTNRIASVSTEQIKKLKLLVAKGDKSRKLQVDRLEESFKEAVKRYSDLQKKVANKQKSYLLVPETVEDGEVDENEDDEKQLQARKTRELAFEQEFIEERERRIKQIESDLLDINQITRELSSVVLSQRDAIDDIERNIDSTGVNVEYGAKEVASAARYQNRSRKKLVILVGIALVCAVVLIIILAVELKK
ncbi:syntaxin-12 [Diorhabda carinulata]|uniref:syntaxin-12 n=1 Tax=Diorhabda sublineata TaxID=1163346 RepID=UPI0024E13569|nr:syntaxin-12 [Diorhabda sublineata]XP_057670945.1 syntaxin-12 [Diorhabda carinulata]